MLYKLLLNIPHKLLLKIKLYRQNICKSFNFDIFIRTVIQSFTAFDFTIMFLSTKKSNSTKIKAIILIKSDFLGSFSIKNKSHKLNICYQLSTVVGSIYLFFCNNLEDSLISEIEMR